MIEKKPVEALKVLQKFYENAYKFDVESDKITPTTDLYFRTSNVMKDVILMLDSND